MDMDHGADASTAHDTAESHGMIVWGDATIYFSHLAMFSNPVHAQQVILEVTLPNDAMRGYRGAKAKHPESTFYSFRPEPFILGDLFPPAAGRPARLTSLVGTLFRDQFEQLGEDEVKDHLVARNVTAKVTRVIVRRKLIPFGKRPVRLEYVLFGKQHELYLAHPINLPPDFDQIIAVKSVGRELTDADLAPGLPLAMPGTKDSAESRVRGDAKAQAEISIGGTPQPVALALGVEVYFSDNDFKR